MMTIEEVSTDAAKASGGVAAVAAACAGGPVKGKACQLCGLAP